MGYASRVVNEYLAAFTSGDFDKAQTLVHDAYSFTGPFLRSGTKDGFFKGASPLVPIVRGYRLLRQWEDGGDVCSVYEFHLQTPATSGSVLMCEWHTVRDGQLTSGRLVFDTAAFRALVPAR
jgi:ketosteroid isomerase-like protein